MRSAVPLLLAAIVAFAPAVQAESCFCGSESASPAQSRESCCCGDAASCCCQSCPGHDEPSDPDGPGNLSGCVCTKSQPRSGPAQQDEIVPAEAISHELSPLLEAPQPALQVAPKLEGDAGPPACRPLLI
ncbi:MAG: hypothetical protein V3T86_02350 [Planctomycetota bacterium]